MKQTTIFFHFLSLLKVSWFPAKMAFLLTSALDSIRVNLDDLLRLLSLATSTNPGSAAQINVALFNSGSTEKMTIFTNPGISNVYWALNAGAEQVDGQGEYSSLHQRKCYTDAN